MSAGTTSTVSRGPFRPDWGREERVKYDTTFFIGMTGVLGTGVALNAAERMMLDCYLYVLRDEEQAYARIDRIGNLNHQVTTYRLVADARAEVKTLQKRARRKAIFQAAIDTTLQEWVKALGDEEKRELGETGIIHTFGLK